jgi:hypothetical protein
MIRSLFLLLTVIGLSGVMIVGSTLGTTPIQSAYSSAAQETSNGQQDEPTDDEPVAEPEPEPGTAAEPVDETNPDPLDESLTEEQQEQLTLDIINANGLVPVNDTTVADGNGNGGGPGTTAREKTCVGNSQGQTFCYEPLPTEQNCLKPINVEDPPLCLPKGD